MSFEHQVTAKVDHGHAALAKDLIQTVAIIEQTLGRLGHFCLNGTIVPERKGAVQPAYSPVKMVAMFDRVRRLFTLPVLIGTVAVFSLTLAVALFLVFSAFPRETATPAPPEIVVIPPHTSTPRIPTAAPTIVPATDLGIPPSPLPGQIGIGAYVQIYGTEGAALNIRADPTLGDNVLFLAYDAEVFSIGDGPVDADGFTWWYLVTPVDNSRAGWAASNFLTVITEP
jgi:hypothetical protein